LNLPQYFFLPLHSTLETGELTCHSQRMDTVECQGFQLSRYAAELAEREGIDVGLIKRMLDLSPRERIMQSQEISAAMLTIMEAGKRFRNES
jgi:hypothetical protein